MLLRHGYFLLRAAHTIQWIENPLKANHVEVEDRAVPSIVWDWKSTAERWRWAVYDIQMGQEGIVVEVEEEANGRRRD